MSPNQNTKNPYQRKKQPDIVIATLIDNTTKMILKNGIEQTSLQAVAKASNLTKGGLLHHFPNKMELLKAVYEKTLVDLEQEINNIMAQDPETHGRFTRAYIQSSTNGLRHKAPNQQIISAMFNTPELSHLWRNWLKEKLTIYPETSLELELIRLATDGMWFNALAGTATHNLTEIEQHLLDKTYPQ